MAVGISSALNRVVSMIFPIATQILIAKNEKIPLFLAAALYGLAGVLSALLPYETKGRVLR